ncbi:MAG: transcriptional regulator EpsA [Polaromonas sp.]|nr:transcriptional regulator EpsA [Polaromonas sp.]
MTTIFENLTSTETSYAIDSNRVLLESINIKTHYEILKWLQGPIQEYLQHEIMISAWGDFGTGAILNDIISPRQDIRSISSESKSITPLISELYQNWITNKNRPLSLNVGNNGFQIISTGHRKEIKKYLGEMKSVIVHGINDERGGLNSLYMMFSSKKYYNEEDRKAIAYMLPHIDFALRQVPHLSHQVHPKNKVAASASVNPQTNELSGREMEVMHWVTLGKTNSEIGSILNISTFTVKNHMCRVFKKINVSNRAQAVGQFNKNIH